MAISAASVKTAAGVTIHPWRRANKAQKNALEKNTPTPKEIIDADALSGGSMSDGETTVAPESICSGSPGWSEMMSPAPGALSPRRSRSPSPEHKSSDATGSDSEDAFGTIFKAVSEQKPAPVMPAPAMRAPESKLSSNSKLFVPMARPMAPEQLTGDAVAPRNHPPPPPMAPPAFAPPAYAAPTKFPILPEKNVPLPPDRDAQLAPPPGLLRPPASVAEVKQPTAPVTPLPPLTRPLAVPLTPLARPKTPSGTWAPPPGLKQPLRTSAVLFVPRSPFGATLSGPRQQ